jgi:hypothetical protein
MKIWPKFGLKNYFEKLFGRNQVFIKWIPDAEAEAASLRGEPVHLRVLFDVDDVAEVGPGRWAK